MRIKALRYLLHVIIDEGYGDWVVWFCDDDDDDYSVNHIYKDDDGDVCLESTDLGYHHEFTAQEILSRMKKYDSEDYVYFKEIGYGDYDECDYYIISEWYIGTDVDGYAILNIDCSEM